MLPCAQQAFHYAVEFLGFLGREGLLLTSVLLLFLVLSGFGRGLGLPSLFWRTTIDSMPQRHRARFGIGVAVGVLLGADALVGMLVESRGRAWSSDFFLRWFLGLCLGAFLGVAAVWLWRPSGSKSEKGIFEQSRLESFLLPLGSAGGLAGFALLLTVLFSHTPPVVVSFISRFIPHVVTPDLVGFHLAAGALLLLGGALYAFLLVLNRAFEWQVLPAVAICLLLTVVSAAHGFVAYRWPAAQIPTYLAGLGIYVFLNAHFQRARVPDLETAARSKEGSSLLCDDDVLKAWRHRHDDRPILVVVAADGGGVRSALWTATVLTRLEQELPSFARHVRLVTGASGGMLGAALWTSTLVDSGGMEPPGHVTGGRKLSPDELLEIAEKGGLSAVASGLVFRDLLPPPLRRGPDRGRELEEVWEKNCAEIEGPLSALAAGEKEGWRPSLVLAPMIVEDGRRLLIANLDLGHLLQNEGPLENRHGQYSLGGVQLFQKLPAAHEKLRSSTAVRLQANFPWVLPSTEIPPLDQGAPRLRVVDAGYYDESGVDLACLWIFRHRKWLKAKTAGVVLVQNRDRSSTIDRQRLPFKQRSCFERGLDGALTPISGLLRAWGSATWFRNDAAVAALARVLDGGTENFFTTVVFELNKEAALTWSITPEEACEIRENVGEPPNQEALAGLKKWWEEASARAHR